MQVVRKRASGVLEDGSFGGCSGVTALTMVLALAARSPMDFQVLHDSVTA